MESYIYTKEKVDSLLDRFVNCSYTVVARTILFLQANLFSFVYHCLQGNSQVNLNGTVDCQYFALFQ